MERPIRTKFGLHNFLNVAFVDKINLHFAISGEGVGFVTVQKRIRNRALLLFQL